LRDAEAGQGFDAAGQLSDQVSAAGSHFPTLKEWLY
jgi:hypothetical protein